MKPSKSGGEQHDPLVGYIVQHEEPMMERSVVQKYRHSPKKHQSPQSFCEMDTEDSGESDVEDTLKAMGLPIDRSLEGG